MRNLNFLGLALSILGGLLISSGIIVCTLLQAANMYNAYISFIFIIGAILAISGIICLFTNKDKKN